MKPAARAGTIATALLLFAACSTGAPTSAPVATGTPAAVAPTPSPAVTPSAAPTADLAHPVGIIAIGHSGLTGEGTAAYAGSWATSTLPNIKSVYLRLIAVRPETEGHVANAAFGGAPASTTTEQATEALRTVPAPALAIISTLDNDIECEGTNIKSVGQSIESGLTAIHTASPNTKILVVGQLGRPSVAFVKELVAKDPNLKAAMAGSDACSFYDLDGKLKEAGFRKLTAVIDAYEAEQARVCASVPNCSTDGGVRRAYLDKLENLSPDYNHLNERGQAAEAELIWPVVQDLLGL
jgi:hypothetical protein